MSRGRRRRAGLVLLSRSRARRRASRRLVLRLPGLPRRRVALDLPPGPRSWGPR